MSTTHSQSLAASMKAGLEGRPKGRLRNMFGQQVQQAVAVPLEQDAYQIALDHIEPDPHQPRHVFDEHELRDLAASIKENGVLQPIIVYRTDDPGRYRIVAGERRYRAAQRAGLSSIPCLELPADFDRSLIDQLQLVENIQRADLRPMEAAEAIETYISRHQLSQREAARRLGKPLSFVAELLAIRKIPQPLLSMEGVSKLPKQTLVEIGRAPMQVQTRLIEQALAGLSLDEVKRHRTNRAPRTRVLHFSEIFILERYPPIEIRWKRHPEDVIDHDLAEALAAVIRIIVRRNSP
jgi:ParB/RepB/Spo0J family partition protein